MSKSAKSQNNGKNHLPSGTSAPPGGTIFLSEILILASSLSDLSMAKKAKWFFHGKKSFFQNNKVESFKNLEIVRSERDFLNFLQATNFDTFMLPN